MLKALTAMWSGDETERDFLNSSGVADTIAEIVVQAHVLSRHTLGVILGVVAAVKTKYALLSAP